AQLKSLITLETAVSKDILQSLLYYGGYPLSAGHVVEGYLAAIGKPGAAARGLGGIHEALSGAEGQTRPSISKPRAAPPGSQRNDVGLTVRDYEGAMSTLCAGCGHDSVTAALIRALWELSIQPHQLAKMSGIGCSSKTPTYFASGAH